MNRNSIKKIMLISSEKEKKKNNSKNLKNLIVLKDNKSKI